MLESDGVAYLLQKEKVCSKIHTNCIVYFQLNRGYGIIIPSISSIDGIRKRNDEEKSIKIPTQV